ncbi:fumarylacetoacetate hydrolase family protein [Microbacterium sp. ASV49]|uniref:Fumarylacetoacetate hydrolase family protein n=1 Tax=Microbacterium candidum TaxID=3041922 RepID=A0ABT7N252_9MICO|nr:fumarylacetoacetate hydrolase family protein [Microbacterium sp. ASV49]MDL9980745.1 fumarylacetoacetate hydrolase family protein [Microbacterium sp. ASV49]
MKLMRIGPARREKPVIRVDEDHYVDVSDVAGDFNEDFFTPGWQERIRDVVERRVSGGLVSAFAGERIGAPIARPHQIVCVGLNYADHAHETGQAIPEEPILFSKSPNTLVGPYDDIRYPRGGSKLDWEVELGIVIGARASYLEDDDEARAAIAGFLVVNDVSERAFQNERGGQWMKGKSAETFNPAGPWLVTPDELPDLAALDLWLTVNGTARQNGSTATMIFDPISVVRYVSQFMVLEPGDLINTGTPPGVALGMAAPAWLVPGDVVELGITGLGNQRQTISPSR